MNYKNIFIAVAASLMLTGCGLYDKYEQKTEIPANVFGTQIEGNGGESLAHNSSNRCWPTIPT